MALLRLLAHEADAHSAWARALGEDEGFGLGPGQRQGQLSSKGGLEARRRDDPSGARDWGNLGRDLRRAQGRPDAAIRVRTQAQSQLRSFRGRRVARVAQGAVELQSDVDLAFPLIDIDHIDEARGRLDGRGSAGARQALCVCGTGHEARGRRAQRHAHRCTYASEMHRPSPCDGRPAVASR